MYYDRILRVWVLDRFDYFLISAFLGSLASYYAKKYTSDEAAMERLKNSIIKESQIISSKPVRVKSKKDKSSLKIALNVKGGQQKYSNDQLLTDAELFELANEIKEIVEQLAAYLKEQEVQGFLRIFFKSGRLVLELILRKCDINITYEPLNQGLKTQIIVFTITTGGVAGFTVSWFKAGAGLSLVVPSVLASIMLIRSVFQQITNYQNYKTFKNILQILLSNPELEKTLRTFFTDGNGRNTLPDKTDGFDTNSNQDPIKEQLKEKYGLIENPTDSELEKIISDRLRAGNQITVSVLQQRLIAALSFQFMLVKVDQPFWELFSSIPESDLEWMILIRSLTGLTLKQIREIIWRLLLLKELKELEKRLEEREKRLQEMAEISKENGIVLIDLAGCLTQKHQKQLAYIKVSLTMELNSRLNDLNSPMLKFIQASKILNDFSSSATPKTPSFLKTKVSNIRTKITKFKPQIKVKKVISRDSISSVFGYGSLVMGALMALLRQDYYESDCKKPMDNFPTSVQIERSLDEWQTLNSPPLTSKATSSTPKGILFPGDYFGKPYIIQWESREEVYSPHSTESPQFEIETFIEYEQEIPSTNGSSSISTNGNNPIITNDPLVSEPITIEIETDLGSGPININK